MKAFVITVQLTWTLAVATTTAWTNDALNAKAEADRVCEWEKDLAFLEKTLNDKHWNAFYKVKKERFSKAVDDLRKRIPRLRDHEIMVGFIRLAAMIGDSHTVLTGTKASPICIKKYAFRRYPVSFVWCRDGLFVEAATKEHQSLVRAKVIGIGKFKLEEILRKLAVLDAADNDSWRKRRVLNRLNQAEVLETMGIVEDMEAAAFSFVDANNKPRRVVLKPLPKGKPAPPATFTKNVLPSRRTPRDWYGVEWFPKAKTLYCWYDRCTDHPKRTVAAWCKQVLAELDAKPVQRFILDMRRNSGGSTTLLQPLINGIRTRKAINKTGNLFVLIGRRTFSSGAGNTWQIRQRTKAVLIGLTAGGSPNGLGAVRYFKFPNCGCTLALSTRWIGRWFARRPPITIKPDVRVEPTSKDYFAGRDPVLEAAVRYKPKADAAGK